jgi:hypothetical protein
MAERPPARADTWFHRHPQKTLAVITLLGILVLVLAAEKILQWQHHRQGIFLETERRYIRLKEYRPKSRMMLAFPRDHLPYTDNVFTKKYPVRVDADGFIMPSRRHARPDVTLVFLGGSSTECMFVDEENRFPFMAGVLLEQQTGKKINSFNGGMSGNNSLHAIDILVNKVMPLQPRVVVFMEDINELSTLLYEGSYWNRNSSRSPLETLKPEKLVGKMLKEIFIPNLNYAYRGFKKALLPDQEDEFAQARGRKPVVDQDWMAAEFSMNLKAFAELCRCRGIIPVFMTQANRISPNPAPVVKAYIERFGRDTGLSYPEFKALYDALNEATRRVGRQNGVMVIDLAAEVPPDKHHLYDMVHFNDRGSRYAAEIIAARLKPLVEGNF